MKVNSHAMNFGVVLTLLCSTIIISCEKKTSDDSAKANLQIRLTDSPDPNVSEVWIDVKDVLINLGDTSSWTSVIGSHAGEYNLLDLTNGKDTILSDAEIPAGTISQIRLLLGDNNYLITKTGEKIDLTTPSAQQSGLKVQVNEDVTGGQLYRLILDFDAGKSIVKAGNSGNFILKPVIRVISFMPSGGNLKGVVLPDSVRTSIFAINGADTIASTYTDTTNGNFLFNDIPAGTYSLSYLPTDTSFKKAQQTVSVALGATAVADTVVLEK